MKLYRYLWLVILLISCGKQRFYKDIFVVKSSIENPPPVDILWVIDNSWSMNDKQIKLADNFSSFIEHFINWKVDFKMAIITTDDYLNRDTEGKLNTAYANSDKDDFINYFSLKILVGDDGSMFEEGLGMSKEFLQNNPSWPREKARLVLFYVSDEDDFSQESVEHYVQYAQDLKQEATLVKVFSLVDTTSDYRGERYIQASTMTSGLVADIQNPFNDIMDEFGKAITKVPSLFKLSKIPSRYKNLGGYESLYQRKTSSTRVGKMEIS